jgi:hypothetical protein
MRLISWFSLIVLVGAFLAGCGEPATNAPEDASFQKQLAEAAAKNPGQPAGSKRAGGAALPPEAAAKTSKPPGAPGK